MTKAVLTAKWAEMERPKSANNVKTIPIVECPQIDWVLSFDGAFGIGLSVRNEKKPSISHNYKKIQFIESHITSEQTYLCFLCEDDLLRELFEQLVLDLLNFCIEHIESDNYPQAIVNRAYAWEALFSKSRGGLNKNAALGLMAELHFLENEWLSQGHPIATWTGPTGAAQDFLDGDTIVELKVKTLSNTIAVSSLEQLDRSLEMYIVAYSAILDEEGESVNDCVARLCQILGSKSIEFMDLVTLTGFVRDKNFKSPIAVKDGAAYFVDESIPVLQVGDITGVVAARYTVDLTSAAPAKLSLEDLRGRLHRR